MIKLKNILTEGKVNEAKNDFSKMYPNSTDLENDIVAWYRSLKKDVGEKYAKEMRADLVKVLMKEGKVNEAQAEFGLDVYKIADSFTLPELRRLKTDGRISDEVYNGATQLLKTWMKNHPTYTPGKGAYKKEMKSKLFSIDNLKVAKQRRGF
jgi:hypothetical protein